MRILIIILTPFRSPIGLGAMVILGFVVAAGLSKSGAGVVGYIQSPEADATCFPSVREYSRQKEYVLSYYQLHKKDPPDGEARFQSAGGLWVKKGEDVLVVQDLGVGFVKISLVSRPNAIRCVLEGRLLHMGLWEWIKWKAHGASSAPTSFLPIPEVKHSAQIVSLNRVRDIWTTSVCSFAPGGGGPGGGLENEELVVGGSGDAYHALLQFDLTGMPKNARQALLQLYCYKTRGSGPTPMALDRLTEPWDWKRSGTGKDRERLWWADRPEATEVKVGLAPCSAGSWYSIDISDLYRQWATGRLPNHGLQLRPLSTDNRWNQFYSSRFVVDPALRPRLVLQ